MEKKDLLSTDRAAGERMAGRRRCIDKRTLTGRTDNGIAKLLLSSSEKKFQLARSSRTAEAICALQVRSTEYFF